MKPDPGTEIRFPVPGSFHTVEPITEGTVMIFSGSARLVFEGHVPLPDLESKVYQYVDKRTFSIKEIKRDYTVHMAVTSVYLEAEVDE